LGGSILAEEHKIHILLHLLPHTSEKETIMAMDLQLDMAMEDTTTLTTVVIIQVLPDMVLVLILTEEEVEEVMEGMETIMEVEVTIVEAMVQVQVGMDQLVVVALEAEIIMHQILE